MTVQRVSEFDIWLPGYALSVVKVFDGGTSNLATLYVDIAKSSTLENPQTLLSSVINGISSGKFAQPVYIDGSYELQIDSVETTGIMRDPIVVLSGEDASLAVVTATGGTEAETLADRFGLIVNAAAYGAIGAGEAAATNDATLTAAIGAAAAENGGCVIAPDGTIPFNDLTIPADVVLCGQGINATVLQSTTGAKVIDVTGDGGGLMNLTLDGVSKVASSIGLQGIDKRIHLENVLIKRFATGIHCKGMEFAQWINASVSDCTDGVKAHGDTDSGGGGLGGPYQNNTWIGGKIDLCSNIGLELSYEDAVCRHNRFDNLSLVDQTGTAVRINGARFTRFAAAWMDSNIVDLAVLDDTDVTVTDNKVIGLTFEDSHINGTSFTIQDTAQDIQFIRSELIGSLTITLTTPDNIVLARDSIIGADVTLAGNAEKWSVIRSINEGGVAGLTTDATVTKAWAFTIEPGQIGNWEAKILANQQNGEDKAAYHIGVIAHRPGSDLDYDAQTVNFTLGTVLTGATSGATAVIIADADAGATGTLALRDIIGTFDDGEIITDTGGGSASVNGTITDQNAAILTSYSILATPYEDDASWAATFEVAGNDIEVHVTGAAAKTVEWFVEVKGVPD